MSLCACAYNLGHALVCSIYCMNKAVGYTKLNNIMGFVHLVTIKNTSKFQRKPRGPNMCLSLLKIFLRYLEKGNPVAVDLSSSRFQTRVVHYLFFWINIILFGNELSTRKEKRPHNFFWKESCVSSGSIHGLLMR